MNVDQCFDAAFEDVVLIEGGYSDNPYDAGGKTMYGITEAVARANGYEGEMRDLPLLQAKRIYRLQYWNQLRLDDISQLSYKVAHEMFDSGVNCGIGSAGKWLQVALNSMNKRATLYPDVVVDNVVGNGTVHACKQYFAKRPGKIAETVLFRALNSQQGAYYLSIGSSRGGANEEFMFGWFANRVA